MRLACLVAVAAAVVALAGCNGGHHRRQGRFLTADLPTLAQEDLVTAGAEAGGNANGWGAHGNRIIRNAAGDLYTTTYAFGSDLNHQNWTLWKRLFGGSTWSSVTTGTIGKTGNPPQVLLAPNGTTVYVLTVSAPDSGAGGVPQIWDSVSNTTSNLPGTWMTGSNLDRAGATYFGSAIDSTGQLIFWEDVPCPFFTVLSGSPPACHTDANVPGTYYWSYRDTGGTWREQQWISNYRQAYNFIFPLSATDLRVAGTRDILPSEAGYPNDSYCAFFYCFDQALEQRWSSWTVQAGMSPRIVRAAVDCCGYTGNHLSTVEDAYVDTIGRTHLLVSVKDGGTGGVYENHHLVIALSGAVTDVLLPTAMPYVNLARITQDTHGNFWAYSVGPGSDGHHCTVYIAGSIPTDTDGTQLGAVTTIPFAGNYDCGSAVRNFDVNQRSGTARADYIDGVVAADNGGSWVHYRIALPVAGGGGGPDEPPVSSFTFTPTSPASGASAAFNGSASSDPDGTVTGFNWTFGDGGTATGATPSHAYTTGGTYLVTLTVTDSAFQTAASSQTIVVTGLGGGGGPPGGGGGGCRLAACTGGAGSGGTPTPPPPALAITNGTPMCDAIAGRRYSNQLLATGGRAPYSWSVPANGAGPPSGLTVSPTGLLSGTPPVGAFGVPGWSRIDTQVTDFTGRAASRPLWLTVVPDWAAVAARGNCVH